MTTHDELLAMQSVCAGPVDEAIVQLEVRLRAAQLAADTRALDALISDDLLFAGPDGTLATKAADLDAHASGAVRFVVHEPQELRMRRVGAACAVSSLRARLVVKVHGHETGGVFRYTRVWALEPDGAWRVVAGQVSAVTAR